MARRSRIRLHASPALVVASLALAVALGGTGYAALKLPRNSVGTTQLTKNAVTSVKVKNGSLLALDFKAGQLPAGAPGQKGGKGDQGPPGNPGPAGAKGPPGLGNLVLRTDENFDSTTLKIVQLKCLAGSSVIGGGHSLSDNALNVGTIAYSYPGDLTTWVARAKWPSAVFPQNWKLKAFAICATVGS